MSRSFLYMVQTHRFIKYVFGDLYQFLICIGQEARTELFGTLNLNHIDLAIVAL